MDENARTLARQIAYALTEVLPTADFSVELGAEITRILGHDDAAETQAMAELLATAKAEIERAAPRQRNTAKSTVYKDLVDLIENLIDAGLISYDQAGELASALRRAVAGVRGRLRAAPPRYYRRPTSSPAEQARRPRRNRPPGPPVAEDEDE